MSDILRDISPVNILEEKEKFFADDSYNPQFEYRRDVATAELEIWGQPKKEIFDHSVKMLEQRPPLKKSLLPVVTPEFIIEQVQTFCRKQDIPVLDVLFSDRYTSRCMITEKSLKFRTPVSYTEKTFADLCRHELETHYLRKLNNSLQPWANLVIPDQVFRRTEEGLASLHTHLYREDKIAWKSYFSYISVYLGQRRSFRDVYTFFIDHAEVRPDTAWALTLRGKRGIKDTSRPGGLTKDITYLEGAVQVWDWIGNEDNDPHDLYLGRLALDQIPEFKPQAVLAGIKYPTFYQDLSTYRSLIADIGRVNEYNTLTACLSS